MEILKPIVGAIVGSAFTLGGVAAVGEFPSNPESPRPIVVLPELGGPDPGSDPDSELENTPNYTKKVPVGKISTKRKHIVQNPSDRRVYREAWIITQLKLDSITVYKGFSFLNAGRNPSPKEQENLEAYFLENPHSGWVHATAGDDSELIIIAAKSKRFRRTQSGKFEGDELEAHDIPR